MSDNRDLTKLRKVLEGFKECSPPVEMTAEEFLLLLFYAARKAKYVGLLKTEAEELYAELAPEWKAENKKVAWTLKNIAEGKSGYPVLLDLRSVEGLSEKVYRVTSFRAAHKILTWLATSPDEDGDNEAATTPAEETSVVSTTAFSCSSFIVSTAQITIELDTEHELPQFNVRVIAPIDMTGVSFIEQSKDPQFQIWTELLNWDDVIFYFQSNNESQRRRRLKDLTGLRFYKQVEGNTFEVTEYRILKGPVDAAQRNPTILVH